jgi:hypothetical protein
LDTKAELFDSVKTVGSSFKRTARIGGFTLDVCSVVVVVVLVVDGREPRIGVTRRHSNI